ncbi:MarR family winged helix-turn-helix transcriptional regulator [Candidatus Harpocratesius sp.]
MNLMDSKHDEVVASFITFMQNIRELLSKNRPRLLKFINKQGLLFHKDPFGKTYNAIIFIGKHGKCKMKEYAEFFHLSPGTATGSVNTLIKRGFVQRANKSSDRRVVEIELTKKGKIIYDKGMEFQQKEIKDILDVLTNEEIESLINILHKLNTSFNIFTDKQ